MLRRKHIKCKLQSDMKQLFSQVLILILFITKVVKSTDISDYHDFQQVEHAKKPIIPILKHSFEQNDEGYQYSYETGNGIHAQESGYIKNKGDEKHETLVQQGTITYHDEHGHPITLHYIADEYGFQPQGAHLPTPPPIPEEIVKVINSHTQAEQQQIVYQTEHEKTQNYAHPEY